MGAAAVPLAIIGSSLLGVGGSIYASNKQASEQASAQRRNEAYQKQMFDLQSQRQQELQDKQTKQAEEWQAARAKEWQQNAFPSPDVVEAERTSGMAKLGTERERRYQELARSLSLRGIGGGGIASGGGEKIEGSYLQGISDLNKNLVTLANTPRFAYPNTQMPIAGFQSTGGTAQAPYQPAMSVSNPLSSAMGFYAMQQMLKGNNPGTSTLTSPYDATYDMAPYASGYMNYVG